jgi:transposase-like protein
MAERVPISETAERLGVSANTIRRRIKSGNSLITGSRMASLVPAQSEAQQQNKAPTRRSSGSFRGRLRGRSLA